jgi:hypothetical protein
MTSVFDPIAQNQGASAKTIIRKRKRQKKKRIEKEREEMALKAGLKVTSDFIKDHMDNLVHKNVNIKRSNEEKWRQVEIMPSHNENINPRPYSKIKTPTDFNISDGGKSIGVIEIDEVYPIFLSTINTVAAAAAAYAKLTDVEKEAELHGGITYDDHLKRQPNQQGGRKTRRKSRKRKSHRKKKRKTKSRRRRKSKKRKTKSRKN